jgi:hypothetical protein
VLVARELELGGRQHLIEPSVCRAESGSVCRGLGLASENR